VSYRTSEEHPFLGREIYEQREFSEHTAQVIDDEVARIVHEAAERAKELLTTRHADLDKLSAALEKNEILDEDEIELLLGPPAYRRADGNGRAEPEPGKPPAIKSEIRPEPGT
jgi:cell division protease FtsH